MLCVQPIITLCVQPIPRREQGAELRVICSIIRAFLVEEQKIVKSVLKEQNKKETAPSKKK